MQEDNILDAIVLQAAQNRTAVTPMPIKPRDNFVRYVSRPVEVRITIAMHTNEIELSLLLEEPPRVFFQDVVQTWLGKSVQAYLFNKDTIKAVVRELTCTIDMIFSKMKSDLPREIRKLNQLDNALSSESSMSETRRQAAMAWEEGHYDELLKLYSELGANLSPLEVMRSKLSKRYLGKPE